MADKRCQEFLAAQRQETPNSVRELGVKKFSQIGLPHRKVESWKYTSLEALRGDYQWPNKDKTQNLPLSQFLPEKIVFFNGGLCPELSCLEKGCEITPLDQEEALNTLSPLLKEKEGEEKEKDGFMALALAYYQEAYKISITQKLKRPLGIYHLFDENFDQCMTHPLLSLNLHPHSHVELYELTRASSPLSSALSNAHTFFHLKEGSEADHLRVFENKQGLMPFSYITAKVEQEASYRNTILALEGGFLRNQLRVSLDEKGANTTLHGLYVHKDRDDSSHFSRIHHRAPHTTSRQLYKGLLNDRAHASFDGGITVAQNCPEIDSAQLNKTILLSPTAHVDSVPQLKINHDHVKCTHGSTVGQLDHRQLFYLQSRGLNYRVAQKILGRAFCREIAAKVQSSALKELGLERLENHHEL